jgi:hypothetical protein
LKTFLNALIEHTLASHRNHNFTSLKLEHTPMQLNYRGHSYTYTAIHVQSAHQPRAINWRYRLPGADQIEILPVTISTASRAVQPRTINWRYQVPAEV